MVPEIDMAAQTSHVENAEENKRPVGIVPVSAQASSHIRRKVRLVPSVNIISMERLLIINF